MAENQEPGPVQGQTPPASDKASEKLQKQVDTLTAKLAAMTQDRDTLAQANRALQADNDQKAEDLAAAEALIAQQTEALKSAEVSIAAGPVIVTHEKEQYRLLVERFSHQGNLVESASLRQNPDLVRQLVEGGSGLLVKVEAAK